MHIRHSHTVYDHVPPLTRICSYIDTPRKQPNRADAHMTLTCIAGLADLKHGIDFDFDEQQRAAFATQGYCLKEFFLPPGVTHPHARMDGVEVAGPGKWQKVFLELGRYVILPRQRSCMSRKKYVRYMVTFRIA